MSLLRVVAALNFMTHGSQKLFGWPSIEPRDPVELVSWFGLAGILEFFGGACMVLGWMTRPVAFILAGEMAVAYFWIHLPADAFPILNGGELAMVYCFLWLFFAAAGPGTVAVDRPHLVEGKHHE